MKKGNIKLFWVFVLFSLSLNVISVKAATSQSDISSLLGQEVPNSQLSGATEVNALPGGGVEIISADSFTNPDGEEVTDLQNTQVDMSGGIKRADSLDYQGSNFQNVENIDLLGNGNFAADFIELFQGLGVILQNAFNVRFENGILTADHADSFVKGSSITTNFEKLNSDAISFSVDNADSVISDCVQVTDVKDSKFTVYSNAVQVEAGKGIFVNINDCSSNDVRFESNNGRVIVSKNIPAVYNIKDGSLSFENDEFKERIDANNTAKVEVDPNFGFSCAIIDPIGTYWYNDQELKKDFGINVPENSPNFKLCLRKNELQEFDDFDGLINFADNFVVLNKIVNYLKYPFQNNGPASLLMNNMFSDLNNFNANFELDNDFNFINRVLIKTNNRGNNNKNIINNQNINNEIINNPNNNLIDDNKNDNIINNGNNIGTEKTTTKPSNYYEIKEKQINNEVHRLLKINFRLNNDELTQNRISQYQTDYFNPIINLNNNILTQNNDENLITVLTPNNEKINRIID